MKSEKGVSLVSLIIYLIAMTIAVGIVARISNYFYRKSKAVSNIADEFVELKDLAMLIIKLFIYIISIYY